MVIFISGLVFKTEIELDIEECQKLEIIMAKREFKTIQQCIEALSETHISLDSNAVLLSFSS